ncbi:lysine-rich arabinogalactan protein 19-like [Penaeus chinensis]|uniref:lysine-rich arabinogalactan protein 19-like n=1 Tax=Penaeus chinensis TaxID=139456 RepID=UPI001FB67FB8|nr:lysine-rich arabinogalactan protein 19-like [Penaeus chinensis]
MELRQALNGEVLTMSTRTQLPKKSTSQPKSTATTPFPLKLRRVCRGIFCVRKKHDLPAARSVKQVLNHATSPIFHVISSKRDIKYVSVRGTPPAQGSPAPPNPSTRPPRPSQPQHKAPPPLPTPAQGSPVPFPATQTRVSLSIPQVKDVKEWHPLRPSVVSHDPSGSEGSRRHSHYLDPSSGTIIPSVPLGVAE